MHMIELDYKEYKNILIVAPHADDEVLGCGGILLKCGSKTDVLLLTDGRYGFSPSKKAYEPEIIDIRKKEFDSVMSAVGARKTICMNIPDREVLQNKKKIYEFNIQNYDAVFVPNKYDAHRDHQAAYRIFKTMKRKQRSKADFFQYEVWTPIREPLYYMDISECFKDISSLLLEYKSQIEARDYLRLAEGLSMYRGAICKVPHAMVYTRHLPGGIMRKLGSLLPNAIKEKAKRFFHI